MAVAEATAESLLTLREESRLSLIWRRFRRHRLAVLGGVVILFFLIVALLAPLIAPYDPLAQDLKLKNAGPSREHLLGTDELGRDTLSRLMYAARISLFVAFTVVLISETIGVIIGAISGFYGGWVDSLIQRFVEFMLSLPTLPLLLALSAIFRDVTFPGLSREWSSAIVIVLVLTSLQWITASRLVRGMVLSLREQEFTQAARALGMSNMGIILRHMIPNAIAPVIVSATLNLGGVIVVESALSFLGFGIQPPIPTWGNMLQNVQNDMWTQPAKAFYPGLCIFLASLSFNYIGDGLRDALDPRLKL
jgi:peptide/nickel transport system permease protein